MFIDKFKSNKKLLLIPVAMIVIAAVGILVYRNVFKKTAVVTESKPALEVGIQTVKDSQVYNQTIEYAAQVLSDQEAQLFAKTTGSVTAANFNPGDKVKIGQELIKIDDVNTASAFGQSGFSAGQVKQAIIGVQQAEAAYNLAKQNYQNVLVSTERDLRAVEIARNQAATGKDNLGSVTSGSLKTSELAYETARIATEQARLSLENRRKIAGQSETDTVTSAKTTADAVANTCGTIIYGINNITALDDNSFISINYRDNLGVLDSSTIYNADNAYIKARDAYNEYLKANYFDLSQKISAVKKLAELTKNLSDATKSLFDKSVSSVYLPQTSVTGLSLSGLQATAAGYQSQMSGALNQINGAESALVNVGLGNDATLDALEKAYQLAKEQESIAKQNLENLKAGNKSQLDNAGYGLDSADNQFISAKAKLNTQLAAAKNQLDIAGLAYNNASISLQNLYDTRLLVSPINGTVTKKLVSRGDTVTAGQLLAVISLPDELRLQFYIDQENLSYLKLGGAVKIESENRGGTGRITSITPQADAFTKRFLIEVTPDDATGYALGTIVNVILEIGKKPLTPGNIILPLSAIDIGQSNNFIYTADNNKAKKSIIEIVKVEGEAAEVKTDLPQEAKIIIRNNKLLNEGDPVTVK